MAKVSAVELGLWNDADDLLAAVARVERDEATEYCEELVALLSHGDPDVREEAMRALFIRGKAIAHRSHAVVALEQDPAPEVRAVAAFSMAATGTLASLEEDTTRLISVLRRSVENIHVRAAAYDGLLLIHRRRAFPSKRREFDSLRDVDWHWIQSLESSEPNP